MEVGEIIMFSILGGFVVYLLSLMFAMIIVDCDEDYDYTDQGGTFIVCCPVFNTLFVVFVFLRYVVVMLCIVVYYIGKAIWWLIVQILSLPQNMKGNPIIKYIKTISKDIKHFIFEV